MPFITAEPTLGLIPEVLDAVDVLFPVGEVLRMVDAHVMKLRDIQHVVGRMAVGVNHAVRPYFPPDNGQESFFSGVGGRQRIQINAALEPTKHGNFSSRPTTSRALAHATKVTLIHFNLPSKRDGFGLQLFGNHQTDLAIEKSHGVGLNSMHIGCGPRRQNSPVSVTAAFSVTSELLTWLVGKVSAFCLRMRGRDRITHAKLSTREQRICLVEHVAKSFENS